MRWLVRSAVLCLAMVVLMPAPAHAWFEWLDYLSGPGRWYGVKTDLRVYCFGREQQTSFQELRTRLGDVDPNALTARSMSDLQKIFADIRQINEGLNVVNLEALATAENNARAAPMQPTAVRDAKAVASRAVDDLEKVSVAIVSGGIFISLCPKEKRRSFAIEAGFTGLGTGGDVNYAQGETIWMTTLTWGLSYRLPLPADRDFVDLGTNVGMYTFYSKGFENFSGFTIEPFVDFHLPTRSRLDASPMKRILGRFTVRAGWAFFPGGFKAEQFASAPGKGDISGSDASTSLTVFYNLKP